MADDSEWTENIDIFQSDPRSQSPQSATNPTERLQSPDNDEFELLEPRHSIDVEDTTDCASCSSVSVCSSVYEHEVVHGRRYHGYRRGLYPFPNDDVEQQREEIHHAMMLDIAVCFIQLSYRLEDLC